MADTSYVSSQGALDVAMLVQTQLADSVLHLFQQGFNPSPTSTLADFLANECDYDGYEPLTIATWADPVLAGQAWAIYAPTQTFRWAFASAGVGNMVQGYFLVLAGGDLKDYTVFNPAEGLTGTGQAVIRTPVEVFPFG